MDFVRVRLHAGDGDDLGTAEVPAGYGLWLEDELLDRDGRLVRVVELIRFPPGSPCSAAVRVEPALEFAR